MKHLSEYQPLQESRIVMDENSTELNKMELAKEDNSKEDEIDTQLPKNFKNDDQKPPNDVKEDDKVNGSAVDDDSYINEKIDDFCDDEANVNVNLSNHDENMTIEAVRTDDKPSEDDEIVVESNNDVNKNDDEKVVESNNDVNKNDVMIKAEIEEVPPRGSKRTREPVKHTDVTPKPKRQLVTHDVKLNCPECNFKCFTKTGILNHLRKHIDEKAKVIKLTCALCPAYFDTNEELVKHKELHRNESHSFICARCKLAFTDHLDWLLHKLDHGSRAAYKCEECHRYFQKKSVFKLHLQTHYDRKLRCGICTETFPTERRLRVHTGQHTRGGYPAPTPPTPPTPPTEPRAQTTRRAHAQSSRVCGECGARCRDAAKLHKHMAIHTGIMVIQCWYCGKGCATEQRRRIHTRVHTDERPFACKTCPQRFKQSADLTRHWCKQGSNQKTLECNVCQKKFKSEQGFTSHMLLHTEDRPFECNDCPKKFVTMKSLEMHVIYKHTIDMPYSCNDCGATFKSTSAFNRHAKSVLGCDKHRKRTKPRKTFD